MARSKSASHVKWSAVQVVGLSALVATGGLLVVPGNAAEPSGALAAGCAVASQVTAVVSILCGFLVRGRALTLTLVVPPLVFLVIMNANA